MATIYIDRQTNTWKLKVKDKRIRLRKALPGEQNATKPPDVLELAARFSISTPVATEPPAPRPDDTAATEPQLRREQPAPAPQPNPASLLEWCDWFDGDYATTRRPDSVKRMSRLLRLLRIYIGKDDRPVETVDYNFLRSFFDWRRALNPKVQGHTIVSEFGVLSSLFREACHRKVMTSNPMKDLLHELRKSFPSPDPVLATKYLTADKVHDLLAAVDDRVSERTRGSNGSRRIHNADCVKIMLSTGLRFGNASNLRWEWIDRTNWTIAVPKEHDKLKTGFVAAVGELGQEVLRRRAPDGTTGRVFPGASPGSVYYFLRSTCGINPHRLRHTFATGLVGKTDLINLCSLLGQKDVKTTQRYAKAVLKDKVAAVAALPW